MNLAADLVVFAKEQGDAQHRAENELLGSARYALRHWGEKNWYRSLVARAEGMLRAHYRAESGMRTSPTLRETVDAFVTRANVMMEETNRPTKDTLESSATTIAASLSTSAINEALQAAAHDDERDDDTLEKVWVSMEDSKVRPTHAAAHGQAVPLTDKFTVGESKMSRPGDISAPIGEWANCRCLMAVRERALPQAVTAAAAEAVNTGVGIFAIPTADDPIWDVSSEDTPHVTTIWLGSLGDDFTGDVDLIKDELAAVVEGVPPFTLAVTGRETLGDDNADVLMLEAGNLGDIRADALGHSSIASAYGAAQQFPQWTVHLTLGYPENPAKSDQVPDAITFDRLGLWVGDEQFEYPLNGEQTMADNETTDTGAPPIPASEAERIDVSEPVPFYGVLAPEGVLSGDMRRFKENSLRARPLPLPLAFQKVNEPGHDGSIKVGNIERTWRRDGKVWGMGHFLSTVPEVDEVVGIMAESGGRTGVSVDADDGTMELTLKDGRSLDQAMEELEPGGEDFIAMDDVITDFTSARICGATQCHIPAFHEAYIALGDVPEDLAPQDGEDLQVASQEELDALVAAGPVKTEDGPGWLTHPVDTDRLRDYWTHGEGAAKIAWGTPGDFNRCRTHLAQYVKPQYLNGYCANRHYDALGFWPGRPVAGDTVEFTGEPDRPALTLVAAGPPAQAPMEWFENPNLTGPSPIVVTEEGRVYGHLAEWGVCHIGISGVCTTAPESPSNYAYFRTGSYLTDKGMVPVGTLTMDTGHMNDLHASASVAVAHYDNTGTAAAYVSAGEDEHGIWVAGVVNPRLTPEQIITLRASKLSGDWREIAGSLELVAGLAVNTGGFPIPHTALAASAGRTTALVAAGIVHARTPRSIKTIVAEAVTETLAAMEARKYREEMAALAAQDAKRKMAALAAGTE